jgi:hypothetical protein
MRKFLQFQKLLAIIVGAWLVCAPTAALIVAVDDRASLVFRPQDVPLVIESGSYSCFIWLRPDETHDMRRRVLSITGGVKVTLEAGGGVRATLLPNGVHATAETSLLPGRWALIAVSRDWSTGRLKIWAGSEGTPLASGFSQAPSGSPGLGTATPVEPPAPEPWALGAFGQEVGVPGAYALVVIRSHAVSDADVGEVWESRRLFAPYDHDNAGAGGRMTGWRGGIHMVGHGVMTGPVDGGVGVDPLLRAGRIGRPVTRTNLQILNFPSEPVGPEWTEFVSVRPIEDVSGFIYRSRLEAPYGGFFARDVPGETLPPWPSQAMTPTTRMLATGPDRPLRIMTSGNSRGVRSGILDPENYMHGLTDFNISQVSGVMLRAASTRGTRRWLGFDAGAGLPIWSSANPVDIAGVPRADFGRFFTATGSSSPVCGSGVLIRPGGFHRLRCGPVEGSLIRADEPLVTEAHLVRFPGSADLLWRPDRGESQQAEGQRIDPARRVSLDTTRHVHTMTTADRMVSDVTLALEDDLTGLVTVGDACFILGGPGMESISVVAAVTLEEGKTLVTLEHPFGRSPEPGSALHFGEWGFHTVRHQWNAIPAGDPDVWRGLELACDELAPGPGMVVVAVSAYRLGVPGFILGAAGWGGRGYDPQLGESFSAAPERWMAMSSADVWIQGFAQQSSMPASMGRYADAIRRGLPNAEIIWAGDTEHGNDPFASWHGYILKEAAARGFGAISLLLDPTLGSFLEQLADGMRTDGAHYSRFGNLALARAWTEQIEIATRCVRADLDGDGALTFFDFLDFSTLFAAGDLKADFDGDGMLTFFDFLVFQEEIARCGG